MYSEYPAIMYAPDGQTVTVKSAAEETELRKEGWVDGHTHFTNLAKSDSQTDLTPMAEAPKPKKARK